MDGMHDLGGRTGFGPVEYRPDETSYHAEWEMRAHAIAALARKAKIFNMDEYRHAVERMEPRHYLGSSYYERVFTACASLLVEKGVLTKDELTRLAGGEVPLSRPAGPGRHSTADAQKWRLGDEVRVKDIHVSGHTRMPGYVRGKRGKIAGFSPAYHFPDSSGHAIAAEVENCYQVQFMSSSLWPGSCDEAFVYVDLFQSYLERV